jgi:integrase
MAKHAIHDGLDDPSQITRQWLQGYLNRQRKDRQGNGYTSVYQDIRAFWVHWVAEETECDGTGQISSLLAQCSGRDFQDLRDRAIILVLLASGLRRFELAALDMTDLDVNARTITVRHGKPAAVTIARLASTAVFAYLIALVLPGGTPNPVLAPLTALLVDGRPARSDRGRAERRDAA